MVKDSLDIDINEYDIDRSHRVGRPTPNRPRPIIVKFLSYKAKSSIYKARNRLKFARQTAKGFHINEDLTKTRLLMFKKALKLKKDNLISDT